MLGINTIPVMRHFIQPTPSTRKHSIRDMLREPGPAQHLHRSMERVGGNLLRWPLVSASAQETCMEMSWYTVLYIDCYNVRVRQIQKFTSNYIYNCWYHFILVLARRTAARIVDINVSVPLWPMHLRNCCRVSTLYMYNAGSIQSSLVQRRRRHCKSASLHD